MALSAQTQTMNYVKSTTYKVATTTSLTAPTADSADVRVVYFDGIGRPIQELSHAASADGTDIIRHIEYDLLGRVTKEYLPFPSQSNTMEFDSNALSNTLNYSQYIDQFPFAESRFANDPIGRLLEKGAPGAAWQVNPDDDSDHTTKMDYAFNTVSDGVYQFAVASSYSATEDVFVNTLVCEKKYPASYLRKVTTKDPNWTIGNAHTTEEFTDDLGNKILVRRHDGERRYDTYYVYDQFNKLAYVIPPKASAEMVSEQSSTIPYFYSKSFDIADVLRTPNGGLVGSGGTLTLTIQNSAISLSMSAGFAPNVIFNLGAEFEFDPLQPVPYTEIPITFYYSTNAPKYKAVIEGDTLRFEDLTPEDAPFVFNNSVYFGASQPLDPLLFSQTTQYTISVDNSYLNGLCYQYRYDYRGRLVNKRIPDKSWEYIVYDQQDRVRATGPANAPFTDSSTDGWLITKYDVFNRPVLKAWKSEATFNNLTRVAFQEACNAAIQISEAKLSSGSDNTVAGVSFRYTNAAAPTSDYHIAELLYYDDYNFSGAPTTFTSIESQAVFYSASKLPIGLPTGQWTRVPETTSLTRRNLTYLLYDYKARPIRTYKTNYLGGSTVNDVKYHFSGLVDYAITRHKRLSHNGLIRTTDRFSYSPQGRVLRHTHQVDNGPETLLSFSRYDELGKLIQKISGGEDIQDMTDAWQTVDYKYNIRGWLTDINDVTSLNDDLFAFRLDYNEGTGDKFYNGNISQTTWITASDNQVRAYQYQYDALDRLTDAFYIKNPWGELGQPDSYGEHLTYDRNGNILTLSRNGEFEDPSQYLQIDDLTYSYKAKSNRLKQVADATLDPNGFNDGATSSDEFDFDEHGDLIRDDNKDITAITYNHLGLPLNITFTGNRSIGYLYDANGAKLRKTVTANSTSVVTDYLDGFQYQDTILQIFPTSEGYVRYNNIDNTVFCNYVFNYQDHLGNNRVSYGLDENGRLAILEENNYYPFGLRHANYNMDAKTYYKFQEPGSPTTPKVSMLPCTDCPYKYKYNGKELQDELGLNVYAYGWRDYDPAIGRWNVVDPLSEKYTTTSPYAFVQNNPMGNREIDGRYFEGRDEKRAARIERRAEKRADKLERKAAKIEARGGNSGDLRDRASELRSTAQDVRDMRNDGDTQYKYASASKPGTAGSGTNGNGHEVVTMYTERNMGSQIHETRHGGQHSRGEVNAVTQDNSITAEVSAYRAQYSWSGTLNLPTLDSSTIPTNIVDFQTDIVNRALMDKNELPLSVRITNITNINQINSGVISNIVEVGQGGGIAPLPTVQNYLMWIYAGLKP